MGVSGASWVAVMAGGSDGNETIACLCCWTLFACASPARSPIMIPIARLSSCFRGVYLRRLLFFSIIFLQVPPDRVIGGQRQHCQIRIVVFFVTCVSSL